MEWVLCIQYRGAWRLIFAEGLGEYSETDFNASGELHKLSDNPYKGAESPILYITRNNWLSTPDVGY